MSTSTSYTQSTYTLPLLQTINDWQIASSRNRAEKIERHSRYLPLYFRQCDIVCFRKVDLEDPFTANLLTDCLYEKVSSWTYSPETAKTLKHGVPSRGKEQGVILWLSPSPSQVILNLTRLYQDQGFLSAIEANRGKIKDYDRGIGRYWDTQDEVILQVESVSTHDVYSLGGYGSNPEKLMWEGSRMSGLPLSTVYQYLSCRAGAHWLSYEGTQRVLDRMQLRVLTYRNVINHHRQ